MKKSWVVLLFAGLLATSSVVAQATQDSILQAEIDEQVWRPFIQAYNAFDAENYNAMNWRAV